MYVNIYVSMFMIVFFYYDNGVVFYYWVLLNIFKENLLIYYLVIYLFRLNIISFGRNFLLFFFIDIFV